VLRSRDSTDFGLECKPLKIINLANQLKINIKENPRINEDNSRQSKVDEQLRNSINSLNSSVAVERSKSYPI